MAFNRKIFGDTFRRGQVPRYPCPRCENGRLRERKHALSLEEPAFSKAEHEHDDWEPDWTAERFSARLECDEPTCGEIVNVIGDTAVVEFMDDENGWHLVTVLAPRAMFPAPSLLSVPSSTPEPVHSELRRAFQLFWGDLGACANRLRTSVELVLDDLKVPREAMNKKGELITLDLNGRIQAFQKSDPDAAATFDALRMVGNLGSHTSDVSREAVLDALELYEDALAEIYGQRSKRLATLRTKIKSTKGKY